MAFPVRQLVRLVFVFVFIRTNSLWLIMIAFNVVVPRLMRLRVPSLAPLKLSLLPSLESRHCRLSGPTICFDLDWTKPPATRSRPQGAQVQKGKA